MTTVREHIQRLADGKWVGDSRNTFRSVDGKYIYTQTGSDITGKHFHTEYEGSLGFLLEAAPVSNDPQRKPRSRLEFRPHPVRTQGSLEEMLFGTIFGNRTDIEALGVVEITEVAPNGRARIKTLWSEQARHALSTLGYPELSSELDAEDDEYVKAEYSDA